MQERVQVYGKVTVTHCWNERNNFKGGVIEAKTKKLYHSLQAILPPYIGDTFGKDGGPEGIPAAPEKCLQLYSDLLAKRKSMSTIAKSGD